MVPPALAVEVSMRVPVLDGVYFLALGIVVIACRRDAAAAASVSHRGVLCQRSLLLGAVEVVRFHGVVCSLHLGFAGAH